MVKVLSALIVLVALAWTGAWFYAAHALGDGFETWRRQEAAQGRIWTCPNRATTGYPFAIALTCSDATFGGQAMGQGVDGSVAGLRAGLSLLHPRSVAVRLMSPFAYKTSDGQTNVTATWTKLDLDVASLPTPDSVALHGTDVAVQGLFGAAGQQGGAAARLDTSFSLAPPETATADRRAVDFVVSVGGTDVAPLDAFMGGTDAVAFDLAGRINRAVGGDARTPVEAIETWRAAGGTLDLARARVTRAASSVSATGTLRLDPAHRPAGRLDAQFIGLEPVLKRYGISGNLASAGALLSTLFGGSRKAPPTEPGALALPISLQDGRLAIGPIRTQVAVPPLY